ncbi:MAG TPA: 50S ribosomal protein L32 [Candidatus Paceibacterota bacterium]|nr:50S ribosomal protein L32 [Candidatus Paceibacterota bacterium]
MVVRMRRNRSQTAKRRSHHALKGMRLAKDSAGNLYLPHRVNPVTGMYKGRVVIDIVAQKKRADRRMKRREKALRESGQDTGQKEAAT